MKKTILSVILTLMIFSAIPLALKAFSLSGFSGSQSFGGQTLFSLPCNDGFLVYIKPAGSSPSTLFFPYGVKTYLNNVFPPVSSTWVLGMAERIPSACILGPCPACITLGYGNKVKYYGSSL